MAMIKVTNVCAKFSLESPVNQRQFILKKLECLCDVRYDPSKFSAIICKFEGQRLTFLIFRNGKIIVIGAKSEDQARECSNVLVDEMRNKLRANYVMKDFKITNICCSSEIPYKLDLLKIAKDDPLNTMYETEIFVNLKYKFNNIKYTISHNGKIFATGFKSQSQAQENFDVLFEFLKIYAKHNAICV